MLYTVLKYYVKYLLTLYFDKIYFHGFDQLEVDRPIIIAVNHPSAFTEALIIPMATKRKLHFIMRGDLFNKWTKWFFRKLRLVPIFRVRDGLGSMKKNKEIFSETSSLLKEREIIVIFVEGLATWEKKLRPIKRGFVRMGYRAYKDQNVEDLLIFPASVNFSYVQDIGHRASVVLGDPIEFRDYVEDLDKNEREGANRLREDVKEGLLRNLVNIEDHENVERTEQEIEALHDHLRPASMRTFYDNHEYGTIEVAASKRDDPSKGGGYAQPEGNDFSQADLLLHKVLRWVAIPPAVIIHILPLLITHKWISATPVKKEFLSGLRIAYFMVVYTVYMVLLCIAIGMLTHSCSIPFVVAILSPVILWASFYELVQKPGARFKRYTSYRTKRNA